MLILKEVGRAGQKEIAVKQAMSGISLVGLPKKPALDSVA